jgi:phosphoribosylformylglycinamidine synthase PurS subunit
VKATVVVRLKREVLDPQGDAVRKALGHLGFQGVKEVRVGKVVEIEIDDAAAGDPAALRARLAEMADALLVNPVIEDGDIAVG